MTVSRAAVVKCLVFLWLTVVWVGLWGDVSIANVLGGMVVAALVMWLLPLPRVPVGGLVHPLSLLALLAVITYYALESSIIVGWLAIRPARPPVTGVLRVQLAIKSDLVLVLCSDVLNLIPGTMVLEIDKVRRTVYVHVLDVGSDKSVQAFYSSTRRLERMFIRAFEREEEWRAPEFGESL